MSNVFHAGCLLGACLITILSPSTSAQEVRKEIEDPAQTPPPARQATAVWHQPQLVVVPDSQIRVLPQADDDPDFAPMREIRGPDGAVVKMVPDGSPYVLAFVNGAFEPPRGLDPALVARLAAGKKTYTYGFVMIRGALSERKMKTLRDLGLALLGPHTWQSVKAKIPVAAVNRLDALPFVHWVGYARPDQKLSPGLAEALRAGRDHEVFEIVVNPFESDLCGESKQVAVGTERVERGGQFVTLPSRAWIPNGPVHKELVKRGFAFDWYVHQIHAFKGRATKAQILKIRDLDCVHTVELHEPMRAFHDQTMAMVSQDLVRGTLPGTRVPVGVIDTGIDGSPLHSDFGNKGMVGFATTSQAWNADGDGHGTHVAGTFFGMGKADVRYKGAAPAIGNGGEGDRIFFGRFMDDNGVAKGNVGNLYDDFSKNYVANGKTNFKPTLINCSWGEDDQNGHRGTEAHCRLADETVYDNDQTYIFAVGNTGTVTGTWASRPAAAKNVLSVGAVTDTWIGSAQPGALWSGSRFRTADNRIKPDLVAPGSIVTSCAINTTTGYKNDSGTSMAAPTVAGCLASLLQRDSRYRHNPAAVKAVAMATAKLDGLPAPHSLTPATASQGHGLISSYKMNFVDPAKDSVVFHTQTGVFQNSRSVKVVRLHIPANAQAAKIMLTWIEPEASSLALQARTNDLRLWIDHPPYKSGYNDGDELLQSSSENTLWHTSSMTKSNSLISKMRGQAVDFKVYGNSITSGSAKWALCVLYYLKAPTVDPMPGPVLQVETDKINVKQSETVRLTATLQAPPASDHFDNGRIWFDGPNDVAVTGMSRKTLDNILQEYNNGSGFPSFQFPSPSRGITGGMAVGQGQRRALDFMLRVPDKNGYLTLVSKATWESKTGTSPLTKGIQICVDSQPPANVSNFRPSSNHQVAHWSRQRTMIFICDWVTDVGCAGIGGFAAAVSHGGAVAPTKQTINQNQTVFYLSGIQDTNDLYFNVRAVDRAGNLSVANSSAGPFWIDSTKPVVSDVVIENGVFSTAKSRVRVQVSASDNLSGLKEMQFSSDGSTWSTPIPFQSVTLYDLSSNGGTTATGTKWVHVRVRDEAGNLSLSKRDSVLYTKHPLIESGVVSKLPSVNFKAFELRGVNFTTINQVDFSSRKFADKWTPANDDAWASGSFRINDDRYMSIFPPQGLPPGKYPVRVKNAQGWSAPFTVTIEANQDRIIRTPRKLTAGKTMDIFVPRSGEAAGSTIVTGSPDLGASILPGLVNLGIGRGFKSLIILPPLGFGPNDIMRLSLPTSTLKGVSVHLQAVYMKTGGQLPVTDIWHTRIL